MPGTNQAALVPRPSSKWAAHSVLRIAGRKVAALIAAIPKVVNGACSTARHAGRSGFRRRAWIGCRGGLDSMPALVSQARETSNICINPPALHRNRSLLPPTGPASHALVLASRIAVGDSLNGAVGTVLNVDGGRGPNG